MAAGEMIVLIGIVCVFLIFGATLGWASRH
jgi:hypothetical protein